MGRQRISDSWFGSLFWMPWKSTNEAQKTEVGILAFEVASLMAKVNNLWYCLSDKEVARFKGEITNSIGIQKLVSENDEYLMDLALNEIVENLGLVARSVVRLGKKGADPVYNRLELFWADPVQYQFEWFGWAYKWKKMERKVKKMERFVAVMGQLSQELEVLAELEQTLHGMQANHNIDQVKLLEFQQKVLWQRQEVKNLREMSPWTRTYDYIVRLLARSLFTILERIKHVFGTSKLAPVDGNNDGEHLNADCLPRSYSFSALMHSSVHPFESNLCGFHPGPLGRSISKTGITMDKNVMANGKQTARHLSSIVHGKDKKSKSKRLSHVGPFKGCMTGSSHLPIVEGCKPTIGGSMRLSSAHTKNSDKLQKPRTGSFSVHDRLYSKLSVFNSKRGLLNGPPSTLGNAALSLHYANVIITIERLVSSPHLIGVDARDDLYNMLPTTIKNALRARLKSCAKALGLSGYDAALAAEWSVALVQILEWLVPLAHNMIRWQSEQNFEKQQTSSGANVLLVQTLYFANQLKTEAAIIELLVGLNYICRVGRDFHEQVMPDIAYSRQDDVYLFHRNDITCSVYE